MAYTTIDNPELYFQAKLYTGSGANQSITLDGSEDMQPDLVWIKDRTNTNNHVLTDSVRGVEKVLLSNANNLEDTYTDGLVAFTSDGFNLGDDDDGQMNVSGNACVSWNWAGGGTAPAITYVVKVVSDSGNKYRFDDFGTSAVTLDLQEGGTYTFDQSDSSNSGHPLRFSTTSNGTHGGGSEYTTGVTVTGTPGNAGAKTVITVAASAPTLYYYCTQHSAMGGQANTNSTFGSSNFNNNTQTTVSAGTTQGFSIVTYTGNANNSARAISHSLGETPGFMLTKNRTGTQVTGTDKWVVFNKSFVAGDYFHLDTNVAKLNSSGYWGGTLPNSSNFFVGGTSANVHNESGINYVAYLWSEKQGFSKFGKYTGNGSTDGTFVYCGFRPAYIITKCTDTARNWNIRDNKINPFNVTESFFEANGSVAEQTDPGYSSIDILSNGFKHRGVGGDTNVSGDDYIFFAFAESPFVNSKGVPNNAR